MAKCQIAIVSQRRCSVKKTTFLSVLGWILGLILVYAAIGKFINSKDFEKAASQISGDNELVSLGLQLIVPGFELALGLYLLLGLDLQWSARLAFLFFSVGTLVVMVLRLTMSDCGCFPVTVNPINVILNEFPATRNAIMIAMAAIIICNEDLPAGRPTVVES